MRFVVFVEGFTEKEVLPSFLKRWLDPQLSQPVGIQTVRFTGWREFRKKIASKARMHVDGPSREKIVAALGLLDLHGPDFYPADRTSAEDRHKWAVENIERQVDRSKFRMFFAVHELEAWIFSKPELFPSRVRKALPGSVTHPETIDFGEPPAKVLNRLYREKLGKEYKKVVYGKALFARLDPAVAYQKCPYLKRMLDEMLVLAKAAGL